MGKAGTGGQMVTPPDETTADPYDVIAALRTECDVALAEKAALSEALARRDSEYGERIEQQSATIDVLKAMSASPGDPQPVFDLIVRQAQARCNSANAILYEYDGMIHCRSIVSNVLPRDALETYVRRFPMSLEQEPNNGVVVSIRDRRIVHINDANAEEGMSTVALSIGVQSGIAVPMIRAGSVVGCIVLSEVRLGG